MANARLLFDLFSSLLLFLVAVVGAWLPFYLSQRGHEPQQRSTLSRALYQMGNCLSAGVMLSAGFCHLLADALKDLAFVGRFPMANFLAAVGFLLTLAADQVIQVVTQGADTSGHGHTKRALSGRKAARAKHTELTGSHFKSGQQGYEKVPLLDSAAGYSGRPVGLPPLPVSSHNGSSTAFSTVSDSVRARALQDAADEDIEADVRLAGSSSRQSPSGVAHAEGHVWQNGSSRVSQAALKEDDPGGQADEAGDWEEGPGHLDVLLVPGGKRLSFATAALLAAALCVHSILEGMALGAQQSLRQMEDIMVAIAAHKGLAAYALGSSVIESGADVKRFWVVTLLFALATPLAIFVGYGLSTVESGMGGAALSALATGTFLYVAMMEIIPRELGHIDGPGWMRVAKLLALLAGFGAMSVLAIWA